MGDEAICSDTANQTALVLANIAEISANTMRGIAGNDISTALNGETLSKQALHHLVISMVTNEAVHVGLPSM